jgi:FAD/FMN-containing dehydrogenase
MTVFAPETIEQAQEWVQARISAQEPFCVRGVGRHFSSQEPTTSLESTRLTRTNFFDPDDMVVGVESGMRVNALQGLLSEKDMVLPVNPWFEDSTVGGLLAANDIGPNRLNMGGLRDCIIGIEYLNGQGERVHAGGKVVKNVTGYDLCRMMLGSLGGLGVITSANFKMMPQPVAPHGLYGRFSDSTWLQNVAALHTGRLPIDWLQALSPAESGTSDWLLGIGFSGNKERRSRLEREIRALFEVPLHLLADGESHPDLPYLPGSARFTGWVSGLRRFWKLPPAHLHLMALMPTSEALNPMRFETLRTDSLRMAIHPIGGDLHFFLDSEEADSQKALINALQPILRRVQGKLVLGNAVPGIGYETLGDFAKPPGYSVAKRLKQHLDPAGVFHSAFYDL